MTDTEKRTGPSPDRILTDYYVRVAVALDTIDLLAERVLNLLASGRRITLVRRYVSHDGTPDVFAGLVEEAPSRLRRRGDPEGAWFGVQLKPGLRGFGFFAYAHDGNATEAEVWARYRAGNDESDPFARRSNITLLEIDGGMAESGPGRNDRLVIQHWNEHGVCEEIIVAFDATDRLTAAVRELEAEIEWQRAVYGNGKDQRALGRLVGMEDALKTVKAVAAR